MSNRAWPDGDDPVATFTAHFRGRAAKQKKDRSGMPLDERLSRCIVEGTKEGLLDDLAVKLKEAKPLDIVNGPLMAGMDEVGRRSTASSRCCTRNSRSSRIGIVAGSAATSP